jgi:RHS repeat-associated protein
VGIANSAGSHIPLMDGLGSTRFLLDSTQNVSDGYEYEAFGRQVSGGGLTPNPYHFVGEYGYYQDWETGLMLLTRRYYDAEVGGFVTRDPIGFGGGDWNTYGYVRGRVTGRTDALGLQDPVTIVVVVVIVVLLGGCSGQGGGKKPTPAPTPPKHTYTLKDITNILTTAGGYVGPAVGSDLSNVANPDFFCMEVIALVQRYGAQAEKMMDEGDTAEMQKDEAVVARGQALLDICKARQSK